MVYKPIFQINTRMIKHLGRIEAVKEIIDNLDISFIVEKQLRDDAIIRTTHYSTKIEGNRLTLEQTKDLLHGKDIIAREIDKKEVMNYYNCLEWIYSNSQADQKITEKLIKKIHSIVQKGIVGGKLCGQYREAQNAIYDSNTRKPVYLPPEAKDVKSLMKFFVNFFNQEKEIHPIIKAGIAHYQLVTIHPFMDGNGRTARALATFIMYKENYDLKKFFSLEDYYSQDLRGYYSALHKCQGNNYYNNKASDISPWLDYFIEGVAIIFEDLKQNVILRSKKSAGKIDMEYIELLQKLGPREKKIFSYFSKNYQLRTRNVANIFKIKDRTARDLINKWINEGILEKRGAGKKDAFYILSEVYQRIL